MRLTASALLLPQLIGMIMLIDSAYAAICYKCSSVTDEWCALNASLADGRCTALTCFETYDADKPGKPTVRGCYSDSSLISGCTKRSQNGQVVYHSCKCNSNYCNDNVLADGTALTSYSKVTWLTAITLIAITLRA